MLNFFSLTRNLGKLVFFLKKPPQIKEIFSKKGHDPKTSLATPIFLPTATHHLWTTLQNYFCLIFLSFFLLNQITILSQRGTQRISYITWTLLGTFLTLIVTVVIFCSVGTLHWLDFLYTLSYIKLGVTLTKYIPQAVLNCQRKSTVGWSIERVLLDLIGGVLSILQMFINAYNYGEFIDCFWLLL